MLKQKWVSFLTIWALAGTSSSWATMLSLPASVIPDVLSESVPLALPPGDLSMDDFEVQWAGPPIPEVRFYLVEGSFEWVRVIDILVVPRARLALEIKSAVQGVISNSGFSQALEIEAAKAEGEGMGSAQIPIALLSGEKNQVHVSFKRGRQMLQGDLQLKFKPRDVLKPLAKRVYFDPSCSSAGVSLETQSEIEESQLSSAGRSSWAYLGCRIVRVQGAAGRVPSLELYVLWDNGSQTIRVEGVPETAPSVSIWPLRLRAQPGRILLETQDSGHQSEGQSSQKLFLSYKLSESFHIGSLGLGIGPYTYRFSGNGESVNNLVPAATLYGAYLASETLQIVTFGLLTMEAHTYVDFGFYLRIENLRLLDRRIGVDLLIGGHAIGFQSLGQFYFIPSLPQGFELIYSDFLGKGKTLTAGGFFYPLISGNSFYDIWLRWGGSVFGEVNYISWQADPNSISFNSTSFGLTVGFPLARFW